MYQADKSDVDRLVREGCDVWTAELWSNWISVSSVFESCLADLRDRYDFDFVSHLVNCVFNKKNRSGHAWIGCLNEKQVAALCGLFELLKQHPDYYSRKEKLSEVVRVVGQGFRPDHAG